VGLVEARRAPAAGSEAVAGWRARAVPPVAPVVRPTAWQLVSALHSARAPEAELRRDARRR